MRDEAIFGALIAAQALHSIEEYLGRLWLVFPPARFVTGLLSQDRRQAFIIINLALIAFGIWCFVWPVRRGWRARGYIIGFWVAIELTNGVGHSWWTLRQQAYTPGALTAPLLLVLAIVLAWQYLGRRS
jgi:hypothetical protein